MRSKSDNENHFVKKYITIIPFLNEDYIFISLYPAFLDMCTLLQIHNIDVEDDLVLSAFVQMQHDFVVFCKIARENYAAEFGLYKFVSVIEFETKYNPKKWKELSKQQKQMIMQLAKVVDVYVNMLLI